METNILKEIALEQRELFLKKNGGTPRAALSNTAPLMKTPHALVVSGIRRCGKSTFLNQIAKSLLKDDFYYFNFEDERLLGFEPSDFSILHEVQIGLFGEQSVFLLDEIQNAPAWEGFVRRMTDAGHKFILTGSNASLLEGELATKLTGRHLEIGMQPFSFKEFLDFQGRKITKKLLLTPSGRAGLNQLFEQYRLEGGFPERLKYGSKEVLSQLYEDIVYRDVAVRHEIKNTRSLRELALYYMSNVSTLCSFNKLKASLGLGSVTTVASYTEHLERSYLISTISVFDASVKRRSIAPKKIFASDTGLANSVSMSFSKNIGALTENLVFLELLRRGKELFYYKTGSGKEVDFACVEGRKVRELVQVSHDIAAASTRKREIDALMEAMAETNVKEGLLLTEGKTEDISEGGRAIHVRDIARWLLGI